MPLARLISQVTGAVWSVEAPVGTAVHAGAAVRIVESMKMEIPICSERDVGVVRLLFARGDRVSDGDIVAVLDPAR